VSRTYVRKALREQVRAAAHYRCGYCLTTEAIVGTPMEIDHLVPEALGGLTEEDNLWLACALCNQHKGNRIAAPDPLTGDNVPLFDPRRQRWHEQFAWTTEQDRIVARTSIGRATLVALDLNRASLVSARKAWTAVGWHPPAEGSRSEPQ
jgi:hypothetical protein